MNCSSIYWLYSKRYYKTLFYPSLQIWYEWGCDPSRR